MRVGDPNPRMGSGKKILQFEKKKKKKRKFILSLGFP
jgi:hypothetical protein